VATRDYLRGFPIFYNLSKDWEHPTGSYVIYLSHYS
jgi:hypothetical protein